MADGRQLARGLFGALAPRRCAADDLAEVADRDQVVERFGELGVADGLALDPDPLEDGLVEQTPGARLRQPIGGLQPVGQLQRDIEACQHVAVVDGQLGLQLLPRDAFPPQPFLFLVEQALGDLVGVVGAEQFAFLPVESAQQLGDTGSFGCDAGVEGGDVVAHVLPDLAATLGVELDGGVVVLDGQFDRPCAVMGLRAGAVLASAADEVLIDPAVAVGSRIDQPSVAFAAVQAAAQVVVVAPVALAARALGIEHLLHGLEGRLVDQRLVATFVDLARVAQRAYVVVVTQQLGQAVGTECASRRTPGAPASQSWRLQDGGELRCPIRSLPGGDGLAAG